MGVPESREITEHRLLSRDFGPDLAVILPREVWQTVSALLYVVTTNMAVQDPSDLGVIIDEMRQLAEMTIDRAVDDSLRADLRGAFGA